MLLKKLSKLYSNVSVTVVQSYSALVRYTDNVVDLDYMHVLNTVVVLYYIVYVLLFLTVHETSKRIQYHLAIVC